MKVEGIHYSSRFIKEFKKLPKPLQKLAVRKEDMFRRNPLHTSLRLHELHGKFRGIWSISLTSSYRIIFERMEGGDILFISIGRYDIYKYL